MWGAIIGDVAGSAAEVLEINAKINKKKRSYHERIQIMDESFPLLGEDCSYTDDTVLTVAIANSILSETSYKENLKKFGQKEINMGLDVYGRSRFGKSFVEWLKEDKTGESYGNGCAMRISPVGFLFDDEEQVIKQAKLATIPSHNHPDSITAACAVANTIFLCRQGHTKEDIKNVISGRYGYDLNFDLELLRHEYVFTSRSVGSVPQAIFCFLESSNFEDAIRKAISIGGDTDTIAAITGSMAEAYYGIPEGLIAQVRKYVPEEYQNIIDRCYQRKDVKHGRNYYKSYTKIN